MPRNRRSCPSPSLYWGEPSFAVHGDVNSKSLQRRRSIRLKHIIKSLLRAIASSPSPERPPLVIILLDDLH
jgi:hypothetical protein